MPSINIRTRLDTSRLDGLVRVLPERTRKATAAAADAIVDDIREHWSGTYPPASSNRESPAVRSGNLDASIRAQPIGDGFTYMISPDLQKAPYATFLEEGWTPWQGGDFQIREFLFPSMRRMRLTYKRYFYDVFK